tara:strand:- start:3000 stop:3812 length:813 start_codon:yes stop_codon:yes gene_type:complete
MKLEEITNSIFKQIRLFHIIIFVIINLITFLISYKYFSSEQTTIHKHTLNISVPRYSSYNLGNYITIVPTSKLFKEYDNLRYNKTYNKLCDLTVDEYDSHIFYFSDEKYLSTFIKDVPIILKIQHRNKDILSNCSDAYVKVTTDLFQNRYQMLLKLLNIKIEEERQKKTERDIAVKEFLVELEKKYGDQPQIQAYLTQVFLEDLRMSYESRLKTRLENELSQNLDLKIKISTQKREEQIKIYRLEKSVIAVILVSFVIFTIFIFRINKNS